MNRLDFRHIGGCRRAGPSMPLDLAFAAELERAVSPPPVPSVVIEQPWRSDAAIHAQRESDRKLALSCGSFADWRQRVDAIRTRLNALHASEWSPELVAVLQSQSERAENVAEQRAIKVARAEKDIDRVQKILRRRDPSLAAVHRDTARRALAQQQEYVTELLEFALFLRATNSSFSDNSRGGPTFTNADDLESYLRSILAA